MNYEIGRSYKVPACAVKRFLASFDGFVPVIGPEHEDAEFLNFPHQHWHVDWRFASPRLWQRALEYFARVDSVTAEQMAYSLVLGRSVVADRFSIEIGDVQFRRMKCRRDFPAYPHHKARWQASLEAAYACKKLKNGICPHKGLPLHTIQPVDGVITCPGHGLRWNAATGALVPHALFIAIPWRARAA